MMTFEEWWWPRKPLGDDLISGDVVTVAEDTRRLMRNKGERDDI